MTKCESGDMIAAINSWKKDPEAAYKFIRDRLSFEMHDQLRHVDKDAFKKEHRRFEMSGYEIEPGQCTKFNMAILNEFADLGIYDYTTYLFLDFYKGVGTVYFQYFCEQEHHEVDFCGYGTVDIIFQIFTITILADRGTRRRDW